MQRWEGESREKLNEKLKLEQKAMLDEQLRSSGRFDDGTGRLAKSALRHGRRVQADEAVHLARGSSSLAPSFEPINFNSGSGIVSPRGFGRALSEITRPMGDSDAARRAAQREELTQALAEQMKQREAEKLVYKLQIWDEERDDLERQGLAQVGHVVGKPRPDIPIDLVPYVKAIAPNRMEGSRYGAPLLDLGPPKTAIVEQTNVNIHAQQRGAGASDGVAAALFRDNTTTDDAYDTQPARRGRRRFLTTGNSSSTDRESVNTPVVFQTTAAVSSQPTLEPRMNFNRSSHFTSNREGGGAESPLQFTTARTTADEETKYRHEEEGEEDERGEQEDEDDAALKKLAAVEDRLDRIMSSLNTGGGGSNKPKTSTGGIIKGGSSGSRRKEEYVENDHSPTDIAGIMRELLEEQRLLRETIVGQGQQHGRGGSTIPKKNSNDVSSRLSRNDAPRSVQENRGVVRKQIVDDEDENLVDSRIDRVSSRNKQRSSSAVIGRHREALLLAANSGVRAGRDDEKDYRYEGKEEGGGQGGRGKSQIAKKPAFGRHDEGLTSAAMRRTSGELVLQLAAQRRAAALEAFKAERQQLKEQQAQERLERQSLRKKLPFRRHEIIKENAAAAHGGNEQYQNQRLEAPRRGQAAIEEVDYVVNDRYSPPKRRTSPSVFNQHGPISSPGPLIDDDAERMYPSNTLAYREPSYGGRGGKIGASSINHYAHTNDAVADDGEFESAAILFAESRFIFPKKSEDTSPIREEKQEKQEGPIMKKQSSSSSTMQSKSRSNSRTSTRGKSAGSSSGILSLLK
jgi:hypothetical protein